MLSRNVLSYGSEAALAEKRLLRAGPLSVVYEEGGLRYVRLGVQEVLRRIYVAVRDRNWGTIPVELADEQIEVGPGWFRITYEARHKQGEIDFTWQGTITGSPNGTLTFHMNGLANTTFLSNRTGFCILHPIKECAGRPCRIEQEDGQVVEGVFPELISPHQPFTNIHTISHEVVPGLQAEVRFAGDIFEMEDQRNWSDASYKTYCTPLSRPYPVEIQAGTRVEQTVTVLLDGDLSAYTQAEKEEQEEPINVTVGTRTGRALPRIGLGIASHGQLLSEQEIARLRVLEPSHLRVDLDLVDGDYVSDLRRAVEEAKGLGVPLEVAVTVSDAAESELAALREQLNAIRPPIGSWLIFQHGQMATTEEAITLARKYLREYAPQAPIGGGTNANFTELNRQRPPAGALDLIGYALNPQVHAFDNASLVENLAAQEDTLKSAHAFAGATPVAVTPITLRPRFNPDATGPEAAIAEDQLPPAVDVRQMSLFGAGWTLGSLKYIAEGGATSVTYYETTGWRGVMETKAGSPLPKLFHALPGGVFPLYHVLADVGEFVGGQVAPLQSSRPLEVDGLALTKEGRTRILLANMEEGEREVQIRLEGEGERLAQVRYLGLENVLKAMESPEQFRAQEGSKIEVSAGQLALRLQPYAVVRVDLVREV